MPASRAIGALTVGAAGAVDVITIAEAPSFAMAVTYTTLADSIWRVLENAAAQQQRSQVITTAAVVKVCRMILSKGES